MIKNLLNQIPTIFNKKSIIYTIKICIALTLALGISLSLDLDKPMWAMIAALFVQTRPETGLIVEKTLFLIGVSFIGVTIGFLIVSFFLPYPGLALLSLFIFITITMYFSASMSHLNMMYGLTQANITCTIVVFYSIANPIYTTSESIFHTGYSRITEIIIGSLCSCLTSYFIAPTKVSDTLTNHTRKSYNLVINYMKDICCTENSKNNQKYNKQVESILHSLVILSNEVSASKYENTNNKNYLAFINKVVQLIQTAHSLRTKGNSETMRKLKSIAPDFKNFDLSSNKLDSSLKHLEINKLISKFNNVVKSYHKSYSTEIDNEVYYTLKNYNNINVTFLTISRTLLLFTCMYLLWVNTEGNSSLLMMVILPSFFSQYFIAIPNPIEIIQKVIIGIIISLPISIFITLNLLSYSIGYFELFILVILGTLILGIITLIHPKLNMYSLGYCFGIISVVQPSNHMDFEIAKSFTVGLSSIFGCIALWLAFKFYPHSPYMLTRKLAIKSIIKDIESLHQGKISEQYYQAKLVKKILCIYQNRKNDTSSEKHIEFALKSLTRTIPNHKL